jgi:hypothetical protein
MAVKDANLMSRFQFALESQRITRLAYVLNFLEFNRHNFPFAKSSCLGVRFDAHSGEFDQAFRRNPISRSGQSDQSDAGA